MKYIFLIVGCLLFIIFFAVFAIANLSREKQIDADKLSVVTTLFPLYDFAKNIGGDKSQVALLLPPGVEAHGFEPKPSDIDKINKADIFVYTGKFMEPWAQDIIEGTNKNVKIVDASTGIEFLKENHEDEEGYKHKEANIHDHSGMDPHVWLDFDYAKIMVDNITKGFIEKDPENASFYRKNAEGYKAKLTNLDNDYKTGLANCQSKVIVYGGHYAFGYLVRRYGLIYLAAQGFSPDSEPTAKDLINLVDQINRNEVKYIFYEELKSPKIAETLARETKTKLLLLNAAHNLSKEDFGKDVTFISIMKENLNNLKTGLQCY